MKLKTILFVVFVACLALTGCGNKDEAPAGGGAAVGGASTQQAEQFLKELEAMPQEQRRMYVQSHMAEMEMIRSNPQYMARFRSLMGAPGAPGAPTAPGTPEAVPPTGQ